MTIIAVETIYRVVVVGFLDEDCSCNLAELALGGGAATSTLQTHLHPPLVPRSPHHSRPHHQHRHRERSNPALSKVLAKIDQWPLVWVPESRWQCCLLQLLLLLDGS